MTISFVFHQRPLAHLSGTNPLSEIYPANTGNLSLAFYISTSPQSLRFVDKRNFSVRLFDVAVILTTITE